MKNEKDMFDIMDNIDQGTAMKVIDEMEIYEDIDAGDVNIESIKSKTFNKIGHVPFSNRATSKRKRIWKAAAILLISIGVGMTVLNHDIVLATVKRAMMFIPGLNSVINNEERVGDVYILESPVIKEINGGTITVKGVLINNYETLILLEGRNINQITNILIKDSQGMEYDIEGYSIVSTTGEWQGSYYYRGQIDENKGFEVILKDLDEFHIPLEIKLAQKYDSYEQMGPTHTSNDITVTAIPFIDYDEQLKISMISQMEEGMKVLSYGSSILAKEPKKTVSLVPKEGKEISPYSTNKHISNHDEFYFNIKDMKNKEFIFSIPFIKVQKDYEDKVTLDIPEKGAINTDNTISISGFPVDFYKVERVDKDTLRVYVNTHYNKESSKRLEMFSLDGTKLPQGGYMTKDNEDTLALEFFEFKIKPNMKKITLHLQRPEIIIRGNWNFNIDL